MLRDQEGATAASGRGTPALSGPFINLYGITRSFWGILVKKSVFLIMAGALLGFPGSEAGAQQILAGQWQLDTTRSTDLDSALDLHAQNNGLRTYSSIPGGQPTSSGLPGSGGAPGVELSTARSPDQAKLVAEVHLLTYGNDMFEIVQTDTTVTFHPLNLAYDNVMLTTDGRKRDVEWDWELDGQLKAEWKGDRLKVERKTDEFQVTEHWSREADTDLLVVEVEVTGRLFQKKLVLRRVYQRRP